MRVKGASNIWALGDSGLVPNAWNGKPSPPTAQFAVRQAKQLAANLVRASKNQDTRPFSYRPLGLMASTITTPWSRFAACTYLVFSVGCFGRVYTCPKCQHCFAKLKLRLIGSGVSCFAQILCRYI
jgi:hypothetical protein